MNNISNKKNITNLLPFILSIAALIFAVVAEVPRFFKFSEEISFHFPQFPELLYIATFLCPYVLLSLFLGNKEKTTRNSTILIVVFALFSLREFIMPYYLSPVQLLFAVFFAAAAIYLIFLYKSKKIDADITIPAIFTIIAYENIIPCLLVLIIGSLDLARFIQLLFCVFMIVSIVISLKGMHKKTAIIITFSIGILLAAMNLYEIIDTFIDPSGVPYGSVSDNIFVFVSNIIAVVGQICLYVSLLLFSLNNTLSITLKRITKTKESPVSPEQKLIDLKHKLDSGEITEEDYQALRKNIINNL